MLEMFRFGCRTVRRDLWDFAGERLSEGPMEQVERHLIRCAACRKEVQAMQEAQRLLAVCREATPPSRAGWTDLRHRLAAEQPGRARMPEYQLSAPRSHWLPRLSMASGFASLLIVVALLYRTSTPQPSSGTGANPSPSVAINEFPPVLPIGDGGTTPASGVIQEGPPLDITDPKSNRVNTIANHAANPESQSSEQVKSPPIKSIVKDTPPKVAVKQPPIREKKVEPEPKDIEYKLKKDNNGRMHWAKNESTPKKKPENIEKNNDVPMLAGADPYVPMGNGYVMGTLTPASYDDEAY